MNLYEDSHVKTALMDAPRIAFAEQGLVLVPAKPTEEMLRSLVDAGGDRICDRWDRALFSQLKRSNLVWKVRLGSIDTHCFDIE